MMVILMNKPAFFDTDYLSSFLRINRTDLILDKYDKIQISSQVKDEICNKGNYHNIKERFTSLYENEDVEVHEIEEGNPEWNTYMELRLMSADIKKDIGEMSVISLAKAKNGILASNNLTDVCKYVKDYNLDHITTATTLVELCDEKLITCSEARSYWRTMKQFKIKLPKTSFDNFYKTHSSPCADFETHKYA